MRVERLGQTVPGEAQELSAAEFAQLWRLKPQAAMAYMQERSGLQRTFNWQDMYADEHVRNFTVSRLTALDALQDVYSAVVRSVGGDLTRRDFIDSVEQALVGKGWWGVREVLDEDTGELVSTRFDAARLQLIYDTNTRAAHAAGQWERIQASKQRFPYLRYVTMDDDRVREQHARWHNVTLPVDDVFWQTRYPPNGWRCRCRVVGVSQAEYDAGISPTGAPLRKSAPAAEAREWVNQRTGEVREIPEGVAPGFDYNVGQARAHWQDAARLLADKVSRAPVELGAALGAAISGDAAGAELVDAAWSAWVDEVLADPVARKRTALLGFVRPQDVARLRAQFKIEVPNAAILVDDSRVVGKKARRHADKGDALTAQDWRSLPAALRVPKAVLLDTANQTLLYVAAPQGAQAQRVVVAPAYSVKGETTANLRTAYWSKLDDLRRELRGGELQLLDGSLE